ncbi:hypothetical protein DXG01_016639 [Tephrocybe rancida]|nr:hypothetical protein DXG01_016639 [Tephrocybe rancida]
MTDSNFSKADKAYPLDYHDNEDIPRPIKTSNKQQLLLAFIAGIIACGALQLVYIPGYFLPSLVIPKHEAQAGNKVEVFASSYVGSSEVHSYPPTHPINADPTLFPSDVGHAGGTPTGAEPAVVLTAPAYPLQTGAVPLVQPNKLGRKSGKGKGSRNFDIFQKWGNLSPWYSVGRGAFGLDSDPTVPDTCRVTGLHLLHRHGARYPTRLGYAAAFGGPSKLAGELNRAAANWNATGKLKFLNEWTYKLGEELLTPFGRQQLYDLGVSMRLKYGFLLKDFTKNNTIPVFRTESQDRMLQSALNFALGFFGYPLEGKYQQSILIEDKDFSNSLAPYYACHNALAKGKGDRGGYYIRQWTTIYLEKALHRLQPQIKGFKLSIEHLYTMQQMYESSFGSPVARVQGYGWIKELLARLTHTKIAHHNPATNATLDDDPITFPLDHSLYVDATHEVVVLNIITALNLTSFAATGPLPWTHIPHNRAFEVTKLAPFATNVQFQLLECASVPGPQIRIIINDGVAPLTGIGGCPEQRDGMCPVDTFVKAQTKLLAETDWDWGCNGDWTVPEGPKWNTTTGSPPERPKHGPTIMAAKPDVEAGQSYARDSYDDQERETLLPSASGTYSAPISSPKPSTTSKRQFGFLHLFLAFLAGAIACGGTQLVVCGPGCFVPSGAKHESAATTKNDVKVLAPPYVGSTEVHNFPPASPTNANPTLFPTNVGYPGGTPTGAEPGVILTAPAYPIHTGAAQLVVPDTLGHKDRGKGKRDFDIFKKWGNLSPWYSVGRGAFGLDSEPTVPETCRVTGLHFLHRHGARYPTQWAAYGGPAKLARKLNKAAADWNATGNLEFLNEWSYKLGEELKDSKLKTFLPQYSLPLVDNNFFHNRPMKLTEPVDDLGISMRMKYGFLLKNFTESNTIPVFRTESQDRMLHSALNFAIGFFGYPLEGKYQQSITIESSGFNNTLAPYDTCPNTNDKRKSERGIYYVQRWTAIYLKDAQSRLQPSIKGYDLNIEDVYIMQQMCAYETVAIGYSKFCELFTEEEWEGFNYAYGSAFGSPVARVQGYGWIKELVARLTHTPITEHNSSTNSTLDNDPTTFPLNQSLYVDATHEVVVLNIITALNLTNFATSGPLPYTHIPENRSFEVSKIAPFATNMQFQLLECTSVPEPQIRIIINDGVTPLTGIKGCPEQADGMCPVDTFVKAQQELLLETDWNYDCHGDWTVPEGPAWQTTNGSPPKA